MTLDREDFRLWLTSHEGHERPFGVTETAWLKECPIATWKRSEGVVCIVTPLTWGPVGIRRRHFRDLPDWALSFVACIDSLPYEWERITVKEALEVLDGVE